MLPTINAKKNKQAHFTNEPYTVIMFQQDIGRAKHQHKPIIAAKKTKRENTELEDAVIQKFYFV